jgi:hypothetical protein
VAWSASILVQIGEVVQKICNKSAAFDDRVTGPVDNQRRHIAVAARVADAHKIPWQSAVGADTDLLLYAIQ